MANDLKYQRLFFIFKNFEKGFGVSGEPSGFIRIVQNGDTARVQAEVINYKARPGTQADMIFLFNHRDFPAWAIYRMNVSGDKASGDFTFDPADIDQKGSGLSDIFGVVFCVSDLADGFVKRSFPLISIKSEERPWKNALLNKLDKPVTPRSQDITGSGGHSPAEVSARTGSAGRPSGGSTDRPVIKKPTEERQIPSAEKYSRSMENDETVGKNSEDFLKRAVDQIFTKTAEPEHKQPEPVENKTAPEGYGGPGKSPNPGKPEVTRNEGADRTKYMDRDTRFNAEFEKYDPFGTTNHAYRWWKCSDMHKANQIFAELKIVLPFELIKDGYIACESYGHVVVGLYNDRRTSRSFLVIGVPADNQDSPGNYHGNSRWESADKNYQPSGYWLTYIDSSSSNVVRATY